jgi:hypothetical protein
MVFNFIQFLLTVQNQIKIFHWQTLSHPQHEAFDEAHEDILDLIDKFVEVHISLYGRPTPEGGFDLDLVNYDSGFKAYIDEWISVLVNDFPNNVDSKDTQLLNIRDEILALLNQLVYRLTLN